MLVDAKRRRVISKFLSGLLRHFGQKFNLKIDKDGWTNLDTVARLISDRFKVDKDVVKLIVNFDEKGRFEIKDSMIRAKYGHSIDVNVRWSENGKIPDKLFHGTHPKNVTSIFKEGLKPVKRKEVHLSPTIQDAVEIGRRYAEKPAVFEIDTKLLFNLGFEIRKKGKVYTTDFVPPECLRIIK